MKMIGNRKHNFAHNHNNNLSVDVNSLTSSFNKFNLASLLNDFVAIYLKSNNDLNAFLFV